MDKEASDKEALGKESRVWKPAGLQLWIGHGYRHRPHQVRNPPGSSPSGGHSLSNAPTVFNTQTLAPHASWSKSRKFEEFGIATRAVTTSTDQIDWSKVPESYKTPLKDSRSGEARGFVYSVRE